VRSAELFSAIATASSEEAIADLTLDRMPGILGSDWVGYYMLDTPRVGIHVRGMPDQDVEMYEREGRKVDVMLAHAMAHHVAMRMDYVDLARFPDFLRFVKRHAIDTRIRQCMIAPVVHGGVVVGSMHFATLVDGRFPTNVLDVGMAMSAHVSSRVAVLRAVDRLDARWAHVLSAREREVAQLAARGLSTEHMARAAGVSPNTIKKHLKSLYAKLHVSSRAELGATLVRGPELPTRLSASDRRPAVRKPGRRA